LRLLGESRDLVILAQDGEGARALPTADDLGILDATLPRRTVAAEAAELPRQPFAAGSGRVLYREDDVTDGRVGPPRQVDDRENHEPSYKPATHAVWYSHRFSLPDVHTSGEHAGAGRVAVVDAAVLRPQGVSPHASAATAASPRVVRARRD